MFERKQNQFEQLKNKFRQDIADEKERLWLEEEQRIKDEEEARLKAEEEARWIEEERKADELATINKDKDYFKWKEQA